MKTLLLSLAEPFRTPRLWALHLPANALLLLAAIAWLRLPDDRVWQLAATSLCALAILFAASLLHSATFLWADERGLSTRQMLRPRWIAMTWLLFCVIAFIILFNVCEDFFNLTRCVNWSDYLYSKSPQQLRPKAGSIVYFNGLRRLCALTQNYLLAAVCLPFAAAGVTRVGSLPAARLLRSWRYWLAFALAALIGLWLPGRIIDWTPGEKLRAMETSFVLRMILAYLLATASWLSLISAVVPLLKPAPRPQS